MHPISIRRAATLALLLSISCACAVSQADDVSMPSVRIVVGAEAEPLEHFAASELESMLEKLFSLSVTVGSTLEPTSAATVLLGRPESNPTLAAAVGEAWPQLSDQGLLLRRLDSDPATLVVGGGSPVAVMWAVYELGERSGIRYLVNQDVYPAKIPWTEWPQLDVTMEPNMRVRCWRLVNELPNGPVSWSMEENARFLRQIAKMKYNRIHCSLWPVQPAVQYTFGGMPKPPGMLYFGLRHPIDDDMVAPEKFPGMDVFTNPELVGAASPDEVRHRFTALVRGILDEARKLGMETGLSIQPFGWPKKFADVLPGSEGAHQLGSVTAGPGKNQSMDDPLLREMVATIIRAYIATYPHIDYVILGMPEHRSWSGQAAGAYEKLVSHYGADLGGYEALCQRARDRTSFPGGGGRVEMMVKGDLSSLWFFDSLVREKQLLSRPGGGPDVKLVYNGVVAELRPLLNKMVPPGGELLSFIDYTASRVLNQREMIQAVPHDHAPATLIFTLADDNVGVLPQLATGSLHALMGDMRDDGWSGFYTRYWTVGDLDPTVHYLARASWQASLTPRQAYEDQVRNVCGADAVEPAVEAFEVIEQITLGLDQHGLGFAFPVPGMMTKHYSSGGLSELLKQDHQQYRRTRALMDEAHRLSRPAGRSYTEYFVERLRFADRYLDAAEAYGATSVAEKAGDTEEARRQIELAYQAIREALQAYAGVAKDHGDLGAVALMNEYCYRPIRDKRNELK